MIQIIVTAIFAFLVYLLLSAGSGDILGLWSSYELITGGILALIVACISGRFFCQSGNFRMANPVRWLTGIFYIIIPFFLEMTKANLDVAYRVISGNIRPGIVRISPGLKTDLGVLMLANSITLTPGTLTVDVDDKTGDFFVHMLNVSDEAAKKKICEDSDIFSHFSFPEWIRRIAE